MIHRRHPSFSGAVVLLLLIGLFIYWKNLRSYFSQGLEQANAKSSHANNPINASDGKRSFGKKGTDNTSPATAQVFNRESAAALKHAADEAPVVPPHISNKPPKRVIRDGLQTYAPNTK